MTTLPARVHVFGDDIDTDVITPGRFLGSTDPAVLAKACFAGLTDDFAARVSLGDLVFAGENFGCGSSREHAPIAIKAVGIGCVVARSFARLFFRNAINVGLPVIECAAAVDAARDGDEASVDLARGTIDVAGKRFGFLPLEPGVLAILQAGGLMPLLRARGATPTTMGIG